MEGLDLSSDEVLTVQILLTEKNIDKYRYDALPPPSTALPPPSDPPSGNAVPSFVVMPDTLDSKEIEAYLGEDGFFSNVYGAEFCTSGWAVMVYFMNKLHANFATPDGIRIRSLHISRDIDADVAAMRHVLYNSKISHTNIDWKWLSVDDDREKTPAIIHEAAAQKLNFLCIDAKDSTAHYITYAILCVKLLETNCSLFVRVLPPNEWTARTVNGLMMFSHIFQKLRLYNIDVAEHHFILIGTNKKRMDGSLLCRKLLHMLNIVEPLAESSANIFTLEYMRGVSSGLLDKILSITDSNVPSMGIIYDINQILEINRIARFASVET